MVGGPGGTGRTDPSGAEVGREDRSKNFMRTCMSLGNKQTK